MKAERIKLDPKYSLAEIERIHILFVLQQANNNRTHTAGLLGIGLRTLQRKLHAYKAAGYEVEGGK